MIINSVFCPTCGQRFHKGPCPEITWVTVKIWIGEQFLFYNVRIPFPPGFISIDPLDERLEKITYAVQEVFQQNMGVSATRERGGDESQ